MSDSTNNNVLTVLWGALMETHIPTFNAPTVDGKVTMLQNAQHLDKTGAVGVM